MRYRPRDLIIIVAVAAAFFGVGLLVLCGSEVVSPWAALIPAGLAALFTAGVLYLYRYLMELRRLSFQDYRQLETMFSLMPAINPRAPLPPMRNWSMAPDMAVLLAEQIRGLGPKVIVEASSGISTLISAYVLESLGAGRVVSLEHDPVYAQKTRDLLERHGLSKWAVVLDAPLVSHRLGSEDHRWYDLSQLDVEQIDLLVVDGPPIQIGDSARYPAVPLLVGKLSSNAVVMLDDGIRSQEKEIARRWVAEFPQFKSEYIATDSGTFIFSSKS
jgi:predicted O-methyltransferase YrrM